jgi:hypothetical protein
MGRKGVSDILGVLPGGRALAVEVKRPGGKPTPSQADFLREVSQAGGLALVITSVEEIRAALEEAGVKAAQERLF